MRPFGRIRNAPPEFCQKKLPGFPTKKNKVGSYFVTYLIRHEEKALLHNHRTKKICTRSFGMNKTKLVNINFCHKYRFREIHIPNFQNINWTYLAKNRHFLLDFKVVGQFSKHGT